MSSIFYLGKSIKDSPPLIYLLKLLVQAHGMQHIAVMLNHKNVLDAVPWIHKSGLPGVCRCKRRGGSSEKGEMGDMRGAEEGRGEAEEGRGEAEAERGDRGRTGRVIVFIFSTFLVSIVTYGYH